MLKEAKEEEDNPALRNAHRKSKEFHNSIVQKIAPKSWKFCTGILHLFTNKGLCARLENSLRFTDDNMWLATKKTEGSKHKIIYGLFLY